MAGSARRPPAEPRASSLEEDLLNCSRMLDPDEKRQSMILKGLLLWQRVGMSKTISRFLRVGLKLNAICREGYLGKNLIG